MAAHINTVAFQGIDTLAIDVQVTITSDRRLDLATTGELISTSSDGRTKTFQATVLPAAWGSHCGPGMGTPSNANVDFWGMTMGRVRNGQLVEGWNSYDFMTCFQQMGVLPQPSL